MIIALMIADGIYDKYDVECVITSGNDGKHMKGSKHPDGYAVDLRKRDFANDTVIEAVVEELQVRLNGKKGNRQGEYDVTISPHNIHIEFDPK